MRYDDSWFDWVDVYLEMHEWPVWVRRAFILTLPISLPLWLGGMMVIFFISLAFLIVTVPFFFIRDLWRR